MRFLLIKLLLVVVILSILAVQMPKHELDLPFWMSQLQCSSATGLVTKIYLESSVFLHRYITFALYFL